MKGNTCQNKGHKQLTIAEGRVEVTSPTGKAVCLTCSNETSENGFDDFPK